MSTLVCVFIYRNEISIFRLFIENKFQLIIYITFICLKRKINDFICDFRILYYNENNYYV